MMNDVKCRVILFSFLLFMLMTGLSKAQPEATHDLRFNALSTTWDNGIPLGNGLMGAMIWEKDGNLRFSLDRADLWDLRSIPEFQIDEWAYSWVYERWIRPNEYQAVQQLFDLPYVRDAGPTRLPASAFEIPLQHLGPPDSVVLSLRDAACTIRWKNGVTLTTFVHATAPAGFFRLTGITGSWAPELKPHSFLLARDRFTTDTIPKGLQKLYYPLPVMRIDPDRYFLHQDTYQGAYYELVLQWKQERDVITGVWVIDKFYPGDAPSLPVIDQANLYMRRGFESCFSEHRDWWAQFWKQSSLKIPDSLMERQWYREMYKLGSASRRGSPAASLQAVWTTDNGDLPPWKNDFHHDLNTQMTYWPAYSSNHLAEAAVFTDWLWNYAPVAEKYTRRFFGADGLNFPGVSALNAYPLGGWIQYAFSTTTSAWLSQHFYWQWKYSMDPQFLKSRAYPWVKQAAVFIEKMGVFLPDSTRMLLLSSSPEVYDNSPKAWFTQNTNYDLALIRSLYSAAAEMADSLKLPEEKLRWEKDLGQWPGLALDSVKYNLLLAPKQPLEFSHRHFSHLMSVYPLGLLDYNRSPEEKTIITSSLEELKRLGAGGWCGYSYAWLGALQARARNGEAAAWALDNFIRGFCLPNSFHVNGDQSDQRRSDDHSRVFTLEGNMGFAAALQEMLLQGHHGVLRIFPAVPAGWSDASFINLRTEGAFLVSAIREKGETRKVRILSEKGGMIRIENPFGTRPAIITGISDYDFEGNYLLLKTSAGQVVNLDTK